MLPGLGLFRDGTIRVAERSAYRYTALRASERSATSPSGIAREGLFRALVCVSLEKERPWLGESQGRSLGESPSWGQSGDIEQTRYPADGSITDARTDGSRRPEQMLAWPLAGNQVKSPAQLVVAIPATIAIR
jgi:hypothetical protein